MIGDLAFAILNRHDILLQQNVAPVAPYNQGKTEAPLDIDYRVEDRARERFDDIGVSQIQLNETKADRS
jgi:hypothetical protein